jgi:hypothetical protein
VRARALSPGNLFAKISAVKTRCATVTITGAITWISLRNWFHSFLAGDDGARREFTVHTVTEDKYGGITPPYKPIWQRNVITSDVWDHVNCNAAAKANGDSLRDSPRACEQT